MVEVPLQKLLFPAAHQELGEIWGSGRRLSAGFDTDPSTVLAPPPARIRTLGEGYSEAPSTLDEAWVGGC